MKAIVDNQNEISPTIKYFIAKIDNEPGVDDLKRLALAYVRDNCDFKTPENPADQYFFQLLANTRSHEPARGGFVPGHRQIGFLDAYELDAMNYVYKLGKCKTQHDDFSIEKHRELKNSSTKSLFGFFNHPVAKSFCAGAVVGLTIYSMMTRSA